MAGGVQVLPPGPMPGSIPRSMPGQHTIGGQGLHGCSDLGIGQLSGSVPNLDEHVGYDPNLISNQGHGHRRNVGPGTLGNIPGQTNNRPKMESQPIGSYALDEPSTDTSFDYPRRELGQTGTKSYDTRNQELPSEMRPLYSARGGESEV